MIPGSPEYLAELAAMQAADPGPMPGEQHSVEWLMERVGKVTASNFKHVMDFTKGGKPTAKRDGYMWDVIVERLTGAPTEHYVNGAMEHGTELEPLARMAYERATGSMVIETGFINHQTIAGCGGSPDGTVGDDGLIEIKAPTTRTHCGILLAEDLSDYIPQMQGLMWITGRQWCSFVCYDNRLPAHLQLYLNKVDRDAEYIRRLEIEVIKFIGEIETIVGDINAKYPSAH